MTKKGLLAITLGSVGLIGTAITAGVGTYKAYPKIKEAQEKEMGFIDTVKYVAGEYVPALAVTVITGGLIVGSEILGERKVNELTKKVTKYKDKFDTVSGWYKDQTKAIKENADEETQKKIADATLENEKTRMSDVDGMELVHTYYDPITKTEFEATKYDIYRALNVVNKDMLTVGEAMYSDFYSALSLELPKEFCEDGWSWGTSSAMWVSPFVEIEEEVRDGKIYIYFVSDRGDGEMMPFEPVENPGDEGWC